MCGYIEPFETNTKFVILMHPKEFKKVKNNTGHFTHQSLKNSELFVGIDFSNHEKINKIIDSYECFVLFPSLDAIDISKTNPAEKSCLNSKKIAIFIVDSTWACTKSMFRQSKNLQQLKHLSFTTSRTSDYKIKVQPQTNYLSTIESTLVVLELLNFWNIENVDEDSLKSFLNPFYKMIEYQQKLIENPMSNAVRFKKRATY